MRSGPGDFESRFNGASRVSKRSSKAVSREFQRRFMGVSRVIKECLSVSGKFQKSFKGVSRIFQ